MSNGNRHHAILVPGFAGFDMIAGLQYYEGTTEILQAGEKSLCVHYFPNLPTAGVETRAQALCRWLAKRVERGSIVLPGDILHLVGHSTGGLDIRQLIVDLHEDDTSAAFKRVFPDAGQDRPERLEELRVNLLGAIRTVQFLSTPHYGSNLAHWACSFAPATRGTACKLYHAARIWGATGCAMFGHVVACSPSLCGNWGFRAALSDALRKMLPCNLDGLAAADARGAYAELLRWLWEMSSDTGALSRLDPVAPMWRPFGCKPRKKLDDSDKAFYQGFGGSIRARSIVTHARKNEGDLCSAFAVFDWLLRNYLPAPLNNKTETIDHLLATGDITVGPDDHDGVVNSASMVWPDSDNSRAVNADHADVIGHFVTDRDHHRYDLLPSRALFDTATFEDLWNNIREYMY